MSGPSPARRIVLGVAGGIAAYKAASLLRLFTEAGHDVTVVPTASALRFVGAPTWAALSGKPVSTDVWSDVEHVPHVRIGQSADLVVVAPATADLLARAAAGLADDLLTTTLLTARCPVVLAPAMHTEMWDHPATQANVATLRARGVHVVAPASGRLTGADTGPGRLPEPAALYAVCLPLLGQGPGPVSAADDPTGCGHDRAATLSEGENAVLTATRGGDAVPTATGGGAAGAADALAGLRVVVSAGGTREPLDPVRYLGNRSSGRQGYALAAVAAAGGASVTLVSANVDLPVPVGVDVVPVGTALELRDAVTRAAEGADVVVMAAAVADFRPRDLATSKIKKTHSGTPDQADESAPTIVLVRNPDVLAGLVEARGNAKLPVIVGFAAETGDASGSVLDHARDKLARKGCDLLVANEVGDGITFGLETNTVHLLFRPGLPGAPRDRDAGPAPKEDIATAVWDGIRAIL
ncbi:bifunctional phosphopantothenoylcysteine decarboxylase/phosphopantothenate synthase [Lapillicoccus sp.]|uniref:bifunctional phosphopantothenoylcysteine decarboxylase/phosphopantothenate synthase n=1 Tax=Lapillicoccus sp. TaxID=1909287 RepID=UPI0039834A16